LSLRGQSFIDFTKNSNSDFFLLLEESVLIGLHGTNVVPKGRVCVVCFNLIFIICVLCMYSFVQEGEECI